MSQRLSRALALAAVIAMSAEAAIAADKAAKPDAPKPDAAPAAAAANPNDKVVAMINGKEIRLSTIVGLYRGNQELRQKPFAEVYDHLIDNAIVAALVLDQAKKAKLENDPQVKAAVADAQNNFMEQVWINKRVESFTISDQAMHDRFAEVVKNWPPTKEEVQVSGILTDTEEQAKQIIADLKSGVSFEEEAKAKSKDQWRNEGGKMGWFGKDVTGLPAEFVDAAFKLKVGETTQAPVRTQYGWHVIRAEDRRMQPPPKFEDVQGAIRETLAREQLQASLAELAKGAQIKRYNPDGSPREAAPAAATAPTPALKP